jgi:hypothetical protein
MSTDVSQVDVTLPFFLTFFISEEIKYKIELSANTLAFISCRREIYQYSR